jgi:hypothetical protein
MLYHVWTNAPSNVELRAQADITDEVPRIGLNQERPEWRTAMFPVGKECDARLLCGMALSELPAKTPEAYVRRVRRMGLDQAWKTWMGRCGMLILSFSRLSGES